MSELTTVARPYAKAAFDFAQDNKALDKWAEMLEFSVAVAENEQVAEFITGVMAPESVAETFIKICGEQLDAHGQNFIKVLAENERLVTLPEVYKQFIELCAEATKEINVEVTSATKLTKVQQKEISAKLEKRLERKVKLNCSVEPSLIAGMIIRAGDLVIDNSVRHQISRLSDAIQS